MDRFSDSTIAYQHYGMGVNLKFIQNINNHLLKDIKTYFQDSNNSVHKARNEIKIINYENKDLVVKSFKIPNIINKIIFRNHIHFLNYP